VARGRSSTIAVQRHARLGEQGPLGVEKQRTQALRAVVDGEDQVAAHGEHGSTGRDVAQTGEWR